MLTIILTSQTHTKTYTEVAKVTLPTPEGLITVLPRHDKVITVLSEGTIVIVLKNGGTINVDTLGGIAQIEHNTVKILLD